MDPEESRLIEVGEKINQSGRKMYKRFLNVVYSQKNNYQINSACKSILNMQLYYI